MEPIAYASTDTIPPARREGRRAGGWTFSVALTAAAVAVGYAIHVRDGEYDPAAIGAVGWGIAFCAAGIACPRGRDRRWGGGAVLLALFAGCLSQFYQLLASPPGGWNWWSNDLQRTTRANFHVFDVGVRVAWALVLFCLWKPALGRRLAFPLLLATFAVLGGWMIRSSPRPHIDVFVFQQVGADALLHGRNPYAIDYPDIYAESGQTDRPVYGQGMTKDGKLGFGFPYMPLSLLLSTAGYVLAGDHRYAQLAAMTAAGALIAYCRPGRVPMLAAVLFLFTPRGLFVLGRGWTEPFVAVGLAGVTFAGCRFRVPSPLYPGERARVRGGASNGAASRHDSTSGPSPLPFPLGTGAREWRRRNSIALAITVGLFLATKQYLVLALPTLFLLLPRPLAWRTLVRLFLPALLVATVVTLPFALWDVRAFLYSVFTVQKVAPFRDDALSYLVWYSQQTGVRPGSAIAWVAFAAVMPGLGLALWRAPRGPAGFAAALALTFLPFIAFNKQAFANYYYFTIAALCCAVAAMPVEAPETSAAADSENRPC